MGYFLKDLLGWGYGWGDFCNGDSRLFRCYYE